MMRKNITKSAGKYTASLFIDDERVLKVNNLETLEDAHEILRNGINERYMRSFPELEGKVITWKQGKTQYKGRIVGCDYWIGITIVNDDNPNMYLTCFYGPLSANGKAIIKKYGEERYSRFPERFAIMVEAIKSGTYNSLKIRRETNKYRTVKLKSGGKSPTSANCPFNQ